MPYLDYRPFGPIPPQPSHVHSGSFDSSGSAAAASHHRHPLAVPPQPSYSSHLLYSHNNLPTPLSVPSSSYPSFYAPYWPSGQSGGPGSHPYYPHVPHHHSHPASLPLPPHAIHHHPPPPPLPIVEYITDIHPEDVLSGRGGATNSHSGNRSFRAMVKEHQEEYLQAKKRDKPSVAAVIVEKIRLRGGRFLRRLDDHPGEISVYVDIGDERAREKTCQALREGAPELRRRQREVAASSDESDQHHNRDNHQQHNDNTKRPLAVALSSSSSYEHLARAPSGDAAAAAAGATACEQWETPLRGPATGARRLTSEEDSDAEGGEADSGGRYCHPHYHHHHHHPADGPIVIRPLARLMPGRGSAAPHPLDRLSAEERDVYLAFLPPCPDIRTKRRKAGEGGGGRVIVPTVRV